MVFLEIIELNCFGLNKFTKKNIKKRAEEDIDLLLNESMRNDTQIIENDSIIVNNDNNNNN